MPQSDPSKTEDATPRRIRKAREEGNVPKSQELTKAVTTTVGTVVAAMHMPALSSHLREIYRYYLTAAPTFEVTPQSVYAEMVHISQELAAMLLPLLFSIGLAAFVCLRVQIGPLWTTKNMGFKWSRFNIFNGLKNMFFSLQTFVRLGRSLVQACVIGSIPALIIFQQFDNFLPLYYATPLGITGFMMDLAFRIILWSLPPLYIIGGFDFWYNRYEHSENLKMSKDEVKDEHRNAEGDPQVKSRQRQEMMKVMGRRMLQDVPKADVVITNPTHIAVALSYNPLLAPAPMVLAKGADHLAKKIKEIALEHRIPIRENVPLARALYKSVEVGEMVPEELYKAVAAILAAIWRMKGKVPQKK